MEKYHFISLSIIYYKSDKEMRWLTEMGLDVGLLVAGFFGALLMTSKSASKDLKTTAFGLLSGVLSANYLTPLVVNFFTIAEGGKFGVAFLLGFLGLKGIEFIASKIKAKSN